MDATRRFRLVALGALLILMLVLLAPTGPLMIRKTNSSIYNRTMALILVEYASAVYTIDDSSLLFWTCSRCQGVTKGFKIHTLVVDIQHCLQVLSTAICFYVGGKMFILVHWASPNSIVSSIKALHLQLLG
jgi:hypothetical protein